jgi:hypothetical protein
VANIKYGFNEDIVLNNVKSYIDKTYSQHYGSKKIQATDVIFAAEHGEGFCIGNIMKYAQRFGKKEGRNEEDLMKIIHYAVILLGKLEQVKKDEYVTYQNELMLDSE